MLRRRPSPQIQHVFELSQQIHKLPRLPLESRKHRLQIPIPQIPRHNFAKHQPEVRRHCQIAAFVQLRRVKPQSAPTHSAALHRPAEDEHYIGVAVVGAAPEDHDH